MGIRPSVHFVVALQLETDGQEITDPRWLALPEDCHGMPMFGPTKEDIDKSRAALDASPDDYDLFEHDMFVFMAYDFNHQRDKEVSDFLVGGSEYDPPGLIGYKISSLPYDNNCLWALAAIYPEYHSKSSFVEIPKVSPEENYSEDAQQWIRAQQGKDVLYPLMVEGCQRKLDRGHNYSTFYHFASGYIDMALWFFNEILKFKTIKRRDLKLGLMWIWR